MPPQWEVEGFVLKPFCLRHLAVLQSIKHPIVTGEGYPEPDDMVLALRICSSDLGIKAIEKKATLKEKWLNAKMMAMPDVMARCIIGFVQYTELYSSSPKVWEKPPKEGSVDVSKAKMPEMLMLAAILLRKMNIREEEVWTMPIGKVSWYATAVGVLEGVDIQTISTEDEEKFDSEREELERFSKEQLAKVKAQMANGKPPLPR